MNFVVPEMVVFDFWDNLRYFLELCLQGTFVVKLPELFGGLDVDLGVRVGDGELLL